MMMRLVITLALTLTLSPEEKGQRLRDSVCLDGFGAGAVLGRLLEGRTKDKAVANFREAAQNSPSPGGRWPG